MDYGVEVEKTPPGARMYLKAVEIVGFKSFADKTRFDLRPGVTSVVGPNGSGKSNIVDAIRWTIGEMSWKSLRSPSMVQVIFQGTARRAATGMAEVTLTFDNASSMLPVEYSEVTVTRRIFRSGESEYHLNKTQCRLRDIRELFLDTGLGGDGYAIIDQGNVDFVLGAKPEERRALFEEAAGVARYKAKREEALRKLEHVEQDMARLSDQMSLLNEQIGKLENDARKAKLFEKYKQELSLQEAAGFVLEIAQLRSELSEIDGRLEPLRAHALDVQVETDTAAAELSTLNIERVERENEALRFNQRLSGLREETGRLEERARHAEERRQDLARRSEALALEIEADRDRASELDPELAKVDAELARAAENRSKLSARLEELRAGLEAAEAEFAGIEGRVSGAESELSSIAEERQALAREAAKSESDAQHLQVEVRAGLRELEKVQARRAEAAATLDDLRTEAGRRELAAAEAQRSAEAADAARRDSLETAKALEGRILQSKTALAHCGARLDAIREQLAGDPAYASAQAVLRAGLPGVLGLVRNLIEVEPDAAPFVEDALGPALSMVVCEELDAAEEAIRWLKAEGKGRVRFVVLSALPQAHGSAVALPTGARVLLDAVRGDGAGARLARALLSDVYRVGSTLHGPYWLSGGSEEAPRVRGELEEGDLGARKAELEARVLEQEAERERLAGLVHAAERASVEALARLKDAEASAREVQLTLAEREKAARLAAEEAELIESDCVRHLAGISLQLESRRGLRERVASLERSYQDAAGALAGLRSARENGKARLTERRAEFEGFQTQGRHLDSQVEFLEGQRRRVERQLVAIDEACQRREAERAEGARVQEELAVEVERAKERLAELGGQLAEEEGRSRAVFERLEAARAAASAKEKELVSLKSLHDDLLAQTHEIELEAQGRRTREEIAVTRLFEQCGLKFEEAREKYQGQETSPDKIQWLRQRIERLGNVNMTAPEEREALGQRLQFLETQSQDLLKAKDDLRSAIGKINANTRENFRHTFEQVQGHFRRIYATLFEGGEADLVLTQPDNLLETGIEIVAQPPGKKLQSISQLSGGEKALTALALLFGFFSVKPSPFCMLDEADAALDDANVERFVRLVREFARQTQFIVISHNKRTMEASDLLYGVTMEESGVSQLISVELQKRDAKPKAPAAEEEDGRAAAAA